LATQARLSVGLSVIVWSHVVRLEFTLSVVTGANVSFLIIYVLLFVGHHHVSLILMITFVVAFADGVKENDKLLELSVRLAHELVEYDTAVLGDGLAVSFILNVILEE